MPDHDKGQQRHQVGELQAEREPQAYLPGGDEPAADDQRRALAAIAAQQQEQRQRDAPRGDHVQMPRLGDAVGGIGEGHSRGGGAEAPQAQLACE